MDTECKYCMIVTTCSKKEEAEKISHTLVEKKLAACVQISSITSYYQWDNALQKDNEFRLVIKTHKRLYKAVEKDIIKNHSYEIPQIVAVDIADGYAPYMQWIDDIVADTPNH